MQTQDVIIKPLISEKSLKDASGGRYTFLVNKKADKTEIKKAIEAVFEVSVVDVKTNITKGTKTRNTRVGKQVKSFSNKKARVKLGKGQSIPIFDEHLGEDKKDSKKKSNKKDEKKTVKKGEEK